MEIFRIFRARMKQSEKLTDLETELRAVRRPPSRRDRRIGELKKKLTRDPDAQ